MTEEDEGLEDERKKNLSILESVLGSSQQTCSSKAAIKAKTFRSATRADQHAQSLDRSHVSTGIFDIQQEMNFKNKMSVCRDVSALHYDPSREEHAAFETKTTETKERCEHGNYECADQICLCLLVMHIKG